MILRVVTASGDVVVFKEPRLVLVTDNNGTPVSVAAQVVNGQTFAVIDSHDPTRFNTVLRNLGLDKVSVVGPFEKATQNGRSNIVLP